MLGQSRLSSLAYLDPEVIPITNSDPVKVISKPHPTKFTSLLITLNTYATEYPVEFVLVTWSKVTKNLTLFPNQRKLMLCLNTVR